MRQCDHFQNLPELPAAEAAFAAGCEECVRLGSGWVHLRQCLVCGHVGCCDSSPHRHATAHFHASAHPVMRSVEPGEQWGWCFVDEAMVALD